MRDAEYFVNLTEKGRERVLEEANQEYWRSRRLLVSTLVESARSIHLAAGWEVDYPVVVDLSARWRDQLDALSHEVRFAVLTAMVRAGVAVPEYREVTEG